MSNLINLRPLLAFSICQLRRLFNYFTSSLLGLITWAAKDKLNKASSWQTKAIYTPLAR